MTSQDCIERRLEVDLSQQFPSQKCQGTNGVCYVFGTVAPLEAALFRKTGKVTAISEYSLLVDYMEFLGKARNVDPRAEEDLVRRVVAAQSSQVKKDADASSNPGEKDHAVQFSPFLDGGPTSALLAATTCQLRRSFTNDLAKISELNQILTEEVRQNGLAGAFKVLNDKKMNLPGPDADLVVQAKDLRGFYHYYRSSQSYIAALKQLEKVAPHMRYGFQVAAKLRSEHPEIHQKLFGKGSTLLAGLSANEKSKVSDLIGNLTFGNSSQNSEYTKSFQAMQEHILKYNTALPGEFFDPTDSPTATSALASLQQTFYAKCELAGAPAFERIRRRLCQNVPTSVGVRVPGLEKKLEDGRHQAWTGSVDSSHATNVKGFQKDSNGEFLIIRDSNPGEARISARKACLIEDSFTVLGPNDEGYKTGRNPYPLSD